MSTSAQTPKLKRPNDTAFKQQRLRAWQPILTPFCVISTFFVIAAVFLSIGSAILVASKSVIDAGPFRYDHDKDPVTFVTFNWPESTSKDVFLYYQLTNFYQNHRRYVKSRSDIQLSGTSQKDKETLGDCTPWEYWDDLPDLPKSFYSIDRQNQSLNSLRLNPCGLIANSKFNDTFDLRDSSNVSVPAKTDGIAWPSDKKKFKNIKGFVNISITQQQNVEDEEFIVWMRTAALPTFKKLHRIIEGGLTEGNYTMVINQQFGDFGGRKAFYLSTTTWIGGRNEFLGWAYVGVGIACVLLCLFFLIKNLIDPRTMGDPAMKQYKN